MNLILTANGEIFGFPAEFGISHVSGETAIAGSLNTKGRNLSKFIQNNENNFNDLANTLSVLPKSSTEFSIDFAKKADKYAFILNISGLICGIMLTNESKQLVLVLDTEKLKNGNNFEKFVADVAGWVKINRLNLIVQNKGNANSFLMLQKLSEDFSNIEIPQSYATYQLIASGVFDLQQTAFGRSVHTLTGLNQLWFAVGGSITDKSFGARLTSERIETDALIFENLYFELQKSATEFICKAAGTFIFKLENMYLGFTLCGAVSNTSFTLSASSLPGARIPLNSRLSFSDLGLSIGVTGTGVSFGLIGRLNTNHLSIFGGFVVTPPRISLLTAALTSTTGRISLKDIVMEVADIQWDAVNCLDVVAIGDFDLTDTSLPEGGITQFPTDPNAENYEQEKTAIEQKVTQGFNKAMDTTLQITRESQLTPLGDKTGQYILTDKGTMRHYRIDRTGKISLNCQIYICTHPLTLGSYDMPMGVFICGTLEIFGVKARFLFLADKGKSLVAVVQIQKIDIHGIFTISKSNKTLPIEPINGGLAGQLVKPNEDGAILYLNIQKDKGELTFYLNAYINILGIFRFDSLVLIKERFVYVNIESEFFGFKILFNLKGSYQNFSTVGFEASVVFDTSGFLEIIQKAQESLKSAAQSVRSGIEKATKKIDDAKRKVLSLDNQIKDFDRKIRDCENNRSKVKWYQLWKKISYTAQIAGYEIAKAGVKIAIGVAYAALEVAQAAVNLGGAIATTVLDSLSYVIGAVTQILWIKSFELGIKATPKEKKISAKLVLTVFGKDVQIEGELDLDNLIDNIKKFVSGKISNQSDKLIDNIKSGETKRAISNGKTFDLRTLSEYKDINKNKEAYAELLTLRDSMDELFIDANNAYFDAYNEEEPNARENATLLTELRWKEELFEQQHSEAFDDRFVESLDTVIQTIRREKEANRADISDEMDKQMDDLLGLIRQINSDNKSRAQRRANRESLFSRLERGSDAKRRLMRSRAAEAEISAEEANEQYAESIANLLQSHLGKTKGDVAEKAKRDLGIALYQFRNPNDTFRKQESDNRPDDEDDL